MRRAERIGGVLLKVISDLGLAKKMSEQRAVTEWPDIVGPRVAEHARALRVTGGRLFIEVDSSVWSQELSLMTRRILREGRSLQPALLDFDRLRSLPSGTLGHEYVHFLEANEIDIVAFAEAS